MADVRRRLFNAIDATPHLTWLVRTERPENVAAMVASVLPGSNGLDHHKLSQILGSRVVCPSLPGNLWLGVRIRTQAEVNERMPHLLRVPAARRVVWCEPREELDLWAAMRSVLAARPGGAMNRSIRNGIDWLIVSGETGKDARPMHPDWVRSLRDQAVAAQVPCFFTGWGEWAPAFDGHVNDIGETCWLMPDGSLADHPFQDTAVLMGRSKTPAGAMIDGREWREVPNGNP